MDPVDRAFLSKLVAIARRNGYRYALHEYLRQCPNDELRSYALHESRADWSVLLPIDKGTKMLYLGSIFGAVSTALARHTENLVVVGSISHALDFIKLRANEERLRNIDVVHVGSGTTLPFQCEAFDIVALNGIPEAIEGLASYETGCNICKSLLKEACRVLKANGILYVGGKNRMGFASRNVPSLFRRSSKNKIPKNFSAFSNNSGSNLFAYTYWGYKKLLRSCGFHSIKLFIPFNSYLFPSYIVCFDDEEALSYVVKSKITPENGDGFLQRFFLTLMRMGLSNRMLKVGRYFVSDYIILAEPKK